MRAFLLYGLMVGVPVTGILFVLEAGADLRAAPAVAGSWRIEAQSDAALTGCTARSPQSMTIVQSGAVITVTLPDDGGQELSGRIDWGTQAAPRLEAEAVVLRASSGVTLVKSVSATLDRSGATPSLEGTLRIALCDSVRDLKFRASPLQVAPTRIDGND